MDRQGVTCSLLTCSVCVCVSVWSSCSWGRKVSAKSDEERSTRWITHLFKERNQVGSAAHDATEQHLKLLERCQRVQTESAAHTLFSYLRTEALSHDTKRPGREADLYLVGKV
jgi:hypothetical protein